VTPSHNLPSPNAHAYILREETSSLLATPLNALDPNSALPFSADQYVDAPHNQGGRYHCTECNRPFRLEKDFRRHVETTKAHRSAVFQCCCTHTSGRKDNFLKHIERKKPCNPTVPFICSCGYRIESDSPDAISLLLKHIKPCGQRKRGRPKKCVMGQPQ
jgi:hypothetical protein